jgi:hypothetical protein
VAGDILSAEDFKSQAELVGTAIKELEDQILPVSVTEAEIASLVEFAEWMMLRMAGIWNSATITNKLRLQRTLFPNGLEVSQEGFGTASDPLFFAGWVPGVDAETSLASPGGFEPPLPP